MRKFLQRRDIRRASAAREPAHRRRRDEEIRGLVRVDEVNICFKFQVSSSRPETCDLKLETDVDFIYTHKTADLFIAAAAMGGLAGGGSATDVAALKEFALNLGLAFQYEDDLLDGDSPYSREKTEALVNETTSAAISALGRLPGDTTFLRELAQKLVGRKV